MTNRFASWFAMGRILAHRLQMTDMPNEPNAIAAVASAATDVIIGLPAPVQRSAFKAVSQLVGALVSYPVAWADRAASRVEAKTAALRVMDAAVAQAAAANAVANPEVVQRAAESLLRKEYRKQENKEQIVRDALDDISNQSESIASTSDSEIEDDWLNVFEKYAEDSSSERMQKLWGKVLSGEIRKPGSFSIRTLRFLSEFSQREAKDFARIAKFSVQSFIPKKVLEGLFDRDITPLMDMEAAGLITNAAGLGVERKIILNVNGVAIFEVNNLALLIKGRPAAVFSFEIIPLTNVGEDISKLIGEFDPISAFRAMWQSIQHDAQLSASLCHSARDQGGVRIRPFEVLRAEAQL